MDFELPEELKMIQSLTRDFVNERLKPLEQDILGQAADMSDARMYLPADTEEELIKMVREMGLWGAGVPREFGGPDLSTLGVCLVEEELAQTVVPFHFGDITPVLFDGNQEQREKYLLTALWGEKRPLLALLEPGRGADLASMQTKASTDNDAYVLSGKKITFSRIGKDYFAIVFAAVGKKSDEVTCFLVIRVPPALRFPAGEKKPAGCLR